MTSVQLNLFSEKITNYSNITTNIPGLKYIENFISVEEEQLLIEKIDTQNWMLDLKRRVQHYGYKYDYKARKVDYSMYLGKLPIWINTIADKLIHSAYINELPNQAIINEYEQGQGITPHIDCKTCFSDTIISLSLSSACIMDFYSITSDIKQSLLLQPRSLVILQGDARYQWKHGISARKSDQWQNQKLLRKRRVSLTFRKAII
jgi:alkylated DNA repair dioxygenase AlkB